MSRVLNALGHNELRTPGARDIVHVPFGFTTDGSGVPTLTYNYGGALSIARSGAGPYIHTISLDNRTNGGGYSRCLGVITNNSSVAMATGSDVNDGTITLTTAAIINSQTIQGVAIIETHYT